MHAMNKYSLVSKIKRTIKNSFIKTQNKNKIPASNKTSNLKHLILLVTWGQWES